MDAETSFLNDGLQEEIVIKQLPGFANERYPNYVFKLYTCLQGLKDPENLIQDNIFAILLDG
jgi:hypothetical protein